jgi:hypothetical protein
LDDKNVRTADVLIDSYEDFAIRKSGECHPAQLDPEMFGDFFGESSVGVSGDQLESPKHTRQKVHSVSPET